jgi:equilibrative nucleoside transporter 1/2/3
MISDHVSKLQDEHVNMDQPQEDLDEQGDTKAISPPDGGSQSKYVRVYQQVKVPAWSVFLTFTITLSLFPAITVLITSQNECEDGASRFSNDLFIPFVFCLFNSCDFIGRLLARRLKEWVTVSNMWIPTFLRLAFFPLILLCDVEGTVLPVIFLHDSWPIVIICLFGLTNGSLVSLAMMSGPAMVAPRHSSLAATFMLFALTLGLCSGSCLSFIMLYISQGSFQ